MGVQSSTMRGSARVFKITSQPTPFVSPCVMPIFKSSFSIMLLGRFGSKGQQMVALQPTKIGKKDEKLSADLQNRMIFPKKVIF
jgi:hypothetical protein